jgi:hypothetical protein
MTVTMTRRPRSIRSITITPRGSEWTTSANNEVSYVWCDHLSHGAETAQTTVTELWTGGMGNLGSLLTTGTEGFLFITP